MPEFNDIGDYTFSTKVTIDLSPDINVSAITASDPVIFKNAQPLNNNPFTQSTYLVLRRLLISSRQRPLQRGPRYTWFPATVTSFTATANTTNGFITVPWDIYLAGPATNIPSNLNNTLFHLGTWLRRVELGAIPSGVSIKAVGVRLRYIDGYPSTPNFDDLGLTTPVIGVVDLADYYDRQYGLVDFYPGSDNSPIIDVQFEYTNTNGSDKTVPVTMYGGVVSYDWVQFDVSFLDWTGISHSLAAYDNSTPAVTFNLDQRIPFPLTSPFSNQNSQMGGFGNLVFNLNEHTNFYNTTADFDVVLSAYFVQEG